MYLDQNVYDAAIERINRLFDDFPVIIAAISGGKDSTVVYNLCLRIAEERGRLPLKVFFLDQEAEWQSTIDYVRTVMNDPRVEPYWFQGPFHLSNATSGDDPWLWCWKEGAEWIREKEPNSIHENITGTDWFHKILTVFPEVYFPGQLSAMIGGVRAEEAPARTLGLTTAATWKDITWGQRKGEVSYTFSPIYDWTWRDVWKAIHQNGYSYNSLYDSLWQYGVSPARMRVSNVHHQTSLPSLGYMREVEPETWDKVVGRLQGINTYHHQSDAYRCPHQLPKMFGGWKEYRDHLLKHLIKDDEIRGRMRKQFAGMDARYADEIQDELTRVEIDAILVNDWYGTLLGIWSSGVGRGYEKRKGTKRDRFSFNPKNGLTRPQEEALVAQGREGKGRDVRGA